MAGSADFHGVFRLHDSEPEDAPEPGSAAVAGGIRFAAIFSLACVDIVRGRIGRSSILSQLVSMVVRGGHAHRSRGEDLVRELVERERFGSTALGRGLAIPHLVTDAVSRQTGAAIACPDGADFASLDGAPTHLVMLLLSPKNARAQHTELMSRLAGLMHDKRLGYVTRSDLTPQGLHEFLSELED